MARFATLSESEDLIDVLVLLAPIGMLQYRECFSKNLWGGNGKGLSKRKLGCVRIHHLPSMGITQHDHQKKIMARLRELPSIPVVSQQEILSESITKVCFEEESSNASTPDTEKPYRSSLESRVNATPLAKISNHRKISSSSLSDKKVCRGNSIDASDTWAAIKTAQKELDRDSKARMLEKVRRRSAVSERDLSISSLERVSIASSVSFISNDLKEGESEEELMNIDAAQQRAQKFDANSRRKSIAYGNNALKSNTLENQLKELKRTVLQQISNTMACDRATLMFIDPVHDQLFFYDGDNCIRFSTSEGLAGYCACTGDRFVVNDPYSHPRFNQNIDRQTGFVTRNIMCEPVRSRIGGAVLAVLQMVNKKNATGFTQQDAEVMEMAVLQVRDALETKFQALVNHQLAWNDGLVRHRTSLESATPRYLDHLKVNQPEELLDTQINQFEQKEKPRGSRRMSVKDTYSDVEQLKARRRKEYSNNVRQAGVGLY